MEDVIKNKIAEMQKAFDPDDLRISQTDPIAKMMLVAMGHQANEIERKIDNSIDKLSDLFCDRVLQNSNIRALPALSAIKIENGHEYSPFTIDSKVSFKHSGSKCNFRPLFPTQIIPGRLVAYCVDNTLIYPGQEPICASWNVDAHRNDVWIAYEAAGEVDNFENVAFALDYPLPENHVVAEICEMAIPIEHTMNKKIDGLNSNFMMVEYWKRHLVQQRLWLYRFGKYTHEKHLAKTEMPGWFHDVFNDEALSQLEGRRYIWIKLTFTGDKTLPLDTSIVFNCIPVANFDISTAKLTYTEPIQRLENEKTGNLFLDVVQDAELADEYFVRDFDVAQYDNNRIRRDIVNLYRHYVDDYYAFIDSNSLHDGTAVRALRNAMIQVYDALDEFKVSASKPYQGTYAIRNPRNNQQPIVITYFVTNGSRANALKAGSKLAASNVAVGEAIALIDAHGGRDKITEPATQRELARFMVGSNDRLFTPIDVKQYCRLEFMRAFGEDSMRYCDIDMSLEPIPVGNHIEKCLFITFTVTSERLFETVYNSDFVEYLQINIDIRKSFCCNIKINLCI